MAERIIDPGERYYAGGTVSKTAGRCGVCEPDPMQAAQYAADQKPVLTVTSGLTRGVVREVPTIKVFPRGGGTIG